MAVGRHEDNEDQEFPGKKGEKRNGCIEVLIPGRFSPIRGSLASCAIEGNGFAIEALETIRRLEAGEPVGRRYCEQLNGFLAKYSPAPPTAR